MVGEMPALGCSSDATVAIARAAVVVGVVVATVVLGDSTATLMVMVMVIAMGERGRGRAPADHGKDSERRNQFPSIDNEHLLLLFCVVR
jgi:hypothetical protein